MATPAYSCPYCAKIVPQDSRSVHDMSHDVPPAPINTRQFDAGRDDYE